MNALDIHFFTHQDNEPAHEPVIRKHPALDEVQHRQNAEALERTFTISDFYRGFNDKTLKAVRHGFEMEPDFTHHDGAERLPVDYLSERILVITTILEQRQEERAARPAEMSSAYKHVEAGTGESVSRWNRKGGKRA